MSRSLNKNDVFQAKDLVLEEVPVPEWGADAVVHVRSITAAQRGQIEADAAAFKESKGKGNFTRTISLRMVVLSCCDETGALLFGMDDLNTLAEKNAAVVSRIADAAMRLSGLSKKELDDAEKH